MKINLINLLAILTIIVLGSACTSQSNMQNTKNIPLAEKRAIPSTKEECLKINGNWAQVGIPGGSYTCDLKANDFNKVCTDGSQCEGTCLASKTEKVGAKSVGVCSQYLTNFSCFKYLKQGRVNDICVE